MLCGAFGLRILVIAVIIHLPGLNRDPDSCANLEGCLPYELRTPNMVCSIVLFESPSPPALDIRCQVAFCGSISSFHCRMNIYRGVGVALKDQTFPKAVEGLSLEPSSWIVDGEKTRDQKLGRRDATSGPVPCWKDPDQSVTSRQVICQHTQFEQPSIKHATISFSQLDNSRLAELTAYFKVACARYMVP